MNRYLFITVCFLLPWMTIRAQKETQFIGSQASIQLNHIKSLWFNSSNAAGLGFESPEDYNIVSAQYDYRKGDYKQVQQGDKETGMMFNTNGATKINKIALWGDFTFFNEYITGSTFNTNMYDSSVDMPYYIADPNKSDWKKQFYDLSAKAAIPVGERMGIGVDVNYFSRKGAKQLDPRSVNINYGILASPSVVFKINQSHSAGISALYQNTFERVDFRNVLSYQDQNVYIMRGLGNSSLGVVGGNSGIDPFYYKGNRYGIGAQYRMDGNTYKILLDAKYAVNTIDVFEQPTKPRRRGSVDKKDIEANVQIIRSGMLMHKLTISVLQSGTDGIEYVQEFNSSSGVQQWVTIAEYIKSTYVNQYASVKYELFSGTENKKDYVWNAGLHLAYKSKDDEYVSPNSVFNAKNILVELPAKRNFTISKRSSLLAGINAGYNVNIDGEYKYGGVDPGSLVVTDLFAKDLLRLTSNYLKAGCSINWTFLLKSKSSLDAGIHWQLVKPDDNGKDRNFLTASFSYIF